MLAADASGSGGKYGRERDRLVVVDVDPTPGHRDHAHRGALVLFLVVVSNVLLLVANRSVPAVLDTASSSRALITDLLGDDHHVVNGSAPPLIHDPCAGNTIPLGDTLAWLSARAWCDRQRYFARGRGSGRFPTTERQDLPNEPIELDVDIDRYIVGGSGLGVVFAGDDEIVAGHLRLPPSVPQKPAFLGASRPCMIGERCRFTIRSYSKNGTRINHNDARFKARLYGPALVDADVVAVGDGVYNVSYVAFDEGAYLVQVKLLTVEGEGSAPDFINRFVPFLVDDIVYQSDHLLRVVREGVAAPVSLCRSADHLQGRWVYLTDGQCRPPYCTIRQGVSLTDLQISDPLGLSLGYVWVPADCYYHLYSPLELYQCSRGCRYANWSLSGDSIGRELLQNLQTIMVDFAPDFEMPMMQPGSPRWAKTIRFRNNKDAYPVTFTMNERSPNDNVVVHHAQNPHRLISPTSVVKMLQPIFHEMENVGKHCDNDAHRRCYFYVNPSIQREAEPEKRRQPSSFFPRLTRDRMRALNTPTRARAESLGSMSVLEGEATTSAHWSGSWDGIHYSSRVRIFDMNDNRWVGGGSMMITQMLINDLCNRPCNPAFAYS